MIYTDFIDEDVSTDLTTIFTQADLQPSVALVEAYSLIGYDEEDFENLDV